MSLSTLSTREKDTIAIEDDAEGAINDWPNDVGFMSCPEQREPVELKVVGQIPEYIRGVLYRTGPGGNDVVTDEGKTFTMNHWFDGFTRTHRFQIHSSDRVTYRSRTACDGMIEKIKKTGSLDDFTFAQRRDPCQSFFKKFMSIFIAQSPPPPPPNENGADRVNCGVTVSVNMPGMPETTSSANGHGGIRSLTGKTDASVLQMIHPETLEPIGVARQNILHPLLTGPFSAAHARTDPETGDFFNFNLELGKGRPTYRVFKVAPDTGLTSIIATIKDATPSYIHSFFLSGKYLILAVWPSKYAVGGIKVLYERNVLDGLADWDPASKSMFYVIDRHHDRGVIATYESEGYFAFHTTNAWDVDDDVVMEVCTYENIDVLKKFYIERLKGSSKEAKAWHGKARPAFTRFTLRGVTTGDAAAEAKRSGGSGVRTAEVTFRKDICFELPSVNPNYVTKPTRYVYGVSDRLQTTLLDGLLKHDTETDTTIYWNTHAHSPSEPIFVANPNSTEEDDGVLLSVVLDGKMEKSYLLILSAKDMIEVARVEMETVVGFGFHGTYFGEGTGRNVDI